MTNIEREAAELLNKFVDEYDKLKERAEKAETEKAVLVEALEKISRQWKSDDTIDGKSLCEIGDIEAGYDEIITVARNALAQISESGDESMGVNCPDCGVEITVSNAGGYLTYCDKCVSDGVKRWGEKNRMWRCWRNNGFFEVGISTNKEQDNVDDSAEQGNPNERNHPYDQIIKAIQKTA